MKKLFTKIYRYLAELKRRTKVWLLCLLIGMVWFWLSLPRPLFNKPTSWVMEDAKGQLLGATIAADGQWRFPYNADVPDKFSKCIVAFEDKRFYYHPGVDILAILRAIRQNAGASHTVSGGSTITMQVMRLSHANNDRSIWNKIIETMQALRLECSYKKKSILALYASNAPFGSNVVGLDAAAWRYYGRSASSLSWGETAALAVLPNAPALVHPGKNQNELLRKRNFLLDKLVENKTIDSVEAELAKAEPLPGAPKPLPQLAPHLLDRFRRDAAQMKTDDEKFSTGLKTTIDVALQKQVNQILKVHHEQLKGNQINNAAAMVVEVETGNILAYTGNIYSPQDSAIESSVDVLASKRSPGSTLKPLLYASLLTDGIMLPGQLIPDIPTQINGYMPENFDLGYDGAVPANRALARSLNIPAVKMLQQYKYQRFYSTLKQCGFTTLNNPADFYGMSLILGGCEINPYQLAGVYSSMARIYNHQSANKGKWNNDDWFMPKYSRRPSTVDRRPSAVDSRLFNYTALWYTFNAMNEVMRPGEEGLWGLFSSAQKIAWKTGTSFGFRDGWAVGITPKYCVLVWVGNTTGEGRPGLTGINTAAPIMFELFRLLPQSKWFTEPQYDFIYGKVCRQSGFKAGINCPDADNKLLPAGADKAPVCPYHKIIHLDAGGTNRVTANCAAPSSMQHVSWFILPPAMEYYYRQRHADYKPLPPFLPGCEAENIKSLDIIYPEEGAVIIIPKEITGEKGKTVFSATTRNKDEKLFWHIDDVYTGFTQNFHQMAAEPSPGHHTLTVMNEEGESVTRSFTIAESER